VIHLVAAKAFIPSRQCGVTAKGKNCQKANDGLQEGAPHGVRGIIVLVTVASAGSAAKNRNAFTTTADLRMYDDMAVSRFRQGSPEGKSTVLKPKDS
jgi:hypothetical protein